MSALRVGMRVRISGCNNPRMNHYVGMEGVIVAPAPYVEGNWLVDCARANIYGAPCCWRPYHLEPILYDGNQLVSWESMKDLWTPAGGVTA